MCCGTVQPLVLALAQCGMHVATPIKFCFSCSSLHTRKSPGTLMSVSSSAGILVFSFLLNKTFRNDNRDFNGAIV